MTAALAKIHIAKKELGLHDDDYRATLERLTGKTSAKGLTDAEAGRVLDEFKRRGWKPKVVAGKADRIRGREATVVILDELSASNPPPASPGSPLKSGGIRRGSKPADSATATKARALWISLWQLGVVRDRSESALESFARRQVKVERLQWMTAGQAYKLIEALKAMAEKAGWLTKAGDDVTTQKRDLCRAQMRTLANWHRTRVPAVVMSCVDNLNDAELERMAETLGRQIRGEA